jgi:hypothetical protein
MTATIQIRRDTAANWTSANPTLNSGEIGYETDTSNFKIGSGALWTATPYAGTTVPFLTGGGSTNLNDGAFQVTGRYRFANGSALSNGPTAPENIVAADGGAVLLVTAYQSGVVVQQLWTDGDGSQPPKAWYRVYDTAWRAWEPIGSWAMSATEGVEGAFRDIDVKRNAAIGGNATVGGNASVTGNMSVSGIPAQIVAPLWSAFAANRLLRSDAFGNQTAVAMAHFTSNGAGQADLSNQTSSVTWTVSGINTTTATVTPSAGTWWGMVIGFSDNVGNKILRVVDTRAYTAASGAVFTLNGSPQNIQNVFLFLIRAT